MLSSLAQSYSLSVTPWTAACQTSLSFNISQNLLKLMSNESMIPSNHLLLPSIFPSIRVFSNKLALWIRWPKYRCFSFAISRANEYSGLISVRTDFFDLLAGQGTFKSILQHHSLELDIQKAKIIASSPNISWQIDEGKKWKQWVS